MVAIKPISAYQAAQIRLQCFTMLAGWGVNHPPKDGEKEHKFVQWDLETRLKKAHEMATWAMSGQLPPKPEKKEETCED